VAYLEREQQRRLVAAARRAYPREACGLLFAPIDGSGRLELIPTAPARNTHMSFRIRAREIERLRGEREAMGERLVGCFHSHLLSRPRPSQADAAGARHLGGLWLIYSLRWERAELFYWDGIAFEKRPLQLL
jgi:proteasome lid subunit RPN8/RPN11